MKSTVGLLAALWGLAGVSYILLKAIVKLMPLSLEVLNYHLSALQWGTLIIWMIFMGFFEGYRGFQQKFAPRVAARTLYLRHNPKPLWVVLAPFFCIGYFYANRRRLITSWSITLTIVLIVQLVRLMSQPWRGMLDSGVCLGLFWGWISVIYFTLKALISDKANSSPELPSGVSC